MLFVKDIVLRRDLSVDLIEPLAPSLPAAAKGPGADDLSAATDSDTGRAGGRAPELLLVLLVLLELVAEGFGATEASAC